MNPDKPSRDEIEAKLTALLLGELSGEEARLLRYAIAQDPELSRLHDRLKLAIELVREVNAKPAETAPLKLSEERRKKLFAHFKTPRQEQPLVKQMRLPSLVTVLVTVALVAVLAAMLLPALSKAKYKSQRIAASYEARQREILAQVNAEPAAAAKRTDEAPVAGTIVPSSPMLAPPPALPPVDTGATVATGGLDDSKIREAYSQKVVGHVNLKSDVVTPVPVANTAIVLPKSDMEENGVAFNLADDQRANVPASIPPGAPALQSAGAVNAFGGGGGIGGAAHGAAEVPNSAPQSWSWNDGSGNRSAGESKLAGVAGDDLAVNKAMPSNEGFYGLVNKDSISGQTAGTSRFYRDRTSNAETDKVPLAGDIPMTGSLFKSTQSEEHTFSGTTFAARTGGNTHVGVTTDSPDNAFTFQMTNGIDPAWAQTLAEPERTRTKDNKFVSRYGYAMPGDQITNSFALDDSEPLSGVRTPAASRAMAGGNNSYNSNVIPIDEFVGLSGSNSFSVQDSAVKIPTGGELEKLQRIDAETLKQAHISQGKIEALAHDSDGDSKDSSKDKLSKEKDRLNGLNSFHSILDSKIKAGVEASGENDLIIRTPATNAPVPQPEVQTTDNAFSTFSLNVSDVSFQLAAASLEKGQMPEMGSVRSEEFINAFDYRDPEAAAGEPIAFASERSRYPFAHNRDLLRFSVKTAAAGRQAGRPLNLVLLLDNSGSMERADRVRIIREALRVLAAQLQPQDTISVVIFARTAHLWLDGVAGNAAGPELEKAGDLTPQGGTNLEEAMRLAYETAHRHYLANGMNRVVLLTDGAANLGNVDANILKEKVEANRKQGIALDCFGIGWEDYNDDLLEQLSRHGDGRYAFINTPEDAAGEFAAKLAGALQIAAADVKVQVEFNPQRVVSYRQIGYAKHQLTKEQFRDNTVDAAEIAAAEAGNALYTVETKPDGSGPVATVRMRYKVPGTTDYRERSWEVPYSGKAVSLEQASVAMRLAATASAFSEWLVASPFAQEVTPDELLKTLSGVPEIYGADARPKKLEWMIRQAKSLSGK